MEDLRKYLEGVKEELVKFYEEFTDEETEEEKGLYDYFSESVLDYNVTLDSSFNYRSSRLYVTLGGPTVYIDTQDNEIVILWGTEKDSIWLPSEICEELDNIIEEFYTCR